MAMLGHAKTLSSVVIILLVQFAFFPVSSQTLQAKEQEKLAPITAHNAAMLKEITLLDSKSGSSLFWSPDSQTLYFGGPDTGAVTAWDIPTNSQKFSLDIGYAAFALSPDGAFIAVNSSGDLGGVEIYDTQTQALKASLHCSGGSLVIAFSSTNSKLLVVNTEGGDAQLSHLDFWVVKPKMQTDTTRSEPCNPDHRVRAAGRVPFILFNPNGQFFLYGTHLFDTVKFTDVAILKDVPEYAISAVAFSPDGKLLATSLNDKNGNSVLIWSSLWSLQNNHPLVSLDLDQDPTIANVTVTGLAFSPNGQILAMTGRAMINNTSTSFIWLWDASKYKPISIIRGIQNNSGQGSMAFSPDGKRLALAETMIHIYGVIE
jgi:WD40 repeat protein